MAFDSHLDSYTQLAGVSSTWYAWIEQGRDVTASVSALSRLALSLRMSEAERIYLFELAGKTDPYRRPPVLAGAYPMGLSAAVDAMTCPAYVLDAGWNAVFSNNAARSLFRGWLDPTDHTTSQTVVAPNLLRFIFRSPSARTLISDWPERARRVVAEFRIDYGRRLGDESLQALVEELCTECPEFAAAWSVQEVLTREGGRRRFEHPELGPLTFDQISCDVAGHADLKLVLLVPG